MHGESLVTFLGRPQIIGCAFAEKKFTYIRMDKPISVLAGKTPLNNADTDIAQHPNACGTLSYHKVWIKFLKENSFMAALVKCSVMVPNTVHYFTLLLQPC